MRLVENIPFFSIFIMMAGGIVTPLLGGKKGARILHLVLVGTVAVMSGLLLGYTSDGTRFCFMMGHFPAPWGNEVRAGALEALMSLVFSIVMFLTVAANTFGAGRSVLCDDESLVQLPSGTHLYQ